jgi:hypothetical protein
MQMKKSWFIKILCLTAVIFFLAFLSGCDGEVCTIWVCGNSDDITSVSFDKIPKYYYDIPDGAPQKGKSVNYDVPKSSTMVFDIYKTGDYMIIVKTRGVSNTIKFKTGSDAGRFVIIDPDQKNYIAVLDVSSMYEPEERTGPMPIKFLSKPADAHVFKMNFSHVFMWNQKLPASLYAKEGYKVSAFKVFFLKPDTVNSISQEDLAEKLSLMVENVE